MINEKSLLTVAGMYEADRQAMAEGCTGLHLMENAGAAVVSEILSRWHPRPAIVLCGPGNNGGDGFVVARLLLAAGWPIQVAALAEPGRMTGDAGANALRWNGQTRLLTPDLLNGDPLVIDALFGAGLKGPLSGVARDCIEMINAHRLDCVAVDIPSGINGDTGEIFGSAARCRLTVTFFRAKPGHILMPGRDRVGELVIADIGIRSQVLDLIKPDTFANGPEVWGETFPRPDFNSHKFSRGHVVIRGGNRMTGAALLAASGARRCGAGLVTLSVAQENAAIYRAGLPGNIIDIADTAGEFATGMADPRVNSVVVGPGLGHGADVQNLVTAALKSRKPTVVDADAMTAFAGDPSRLLSLLKPHHVLTPHEGEFDRIFDVTGDKLRRTRIAARQCGAVILLKGADTVIATPDGRAVINATGTPYLATAGSGDVLAGFIAGLLAQGMAPFFAACAAAWLHGRAAETYGPGLIAEDLPDTLPVVLSQLLQELD